MERIIPLKYLTVKRMFENEPLYAGLSDGLVKLLLPNNLIISLKPYGIPETMTDLCDNICYAQKIFLSKECKTDLEIIMRMITGYFYPVVTGKKWDEENALRWSKKIFGLLVQDAYPIATHIFKLKGELLKREYDYLHREPKKEEKIAGIDRLAKYAELDAIDYLSDVLKITRDEVLLTPYNTCLVRFMQAKDKAVFNEKLTEVYKNQAEKKPKYSK